MNRARLHERYMYWHNRALTTAFMSLAARLGRCVYVPGIGYAVNDPALAVEILGNDAFTSTGKGSMDAFITGLVGDAALINMQGSAHRELRTRLHDVFTRRNLDATVQATVQHLAAQLRADLEAGKEVDIVGFTHQLTSRAVCAVLGIKVEGADQEAQYAEIAHVATRLTSFLGVDKLEPSPAYILIGKMKSAGASFEDSAGVIAVMLAAGTETVSAALPRLIALLIDSGQFAPLAANRELLPRAIAEGLRLIVPSPAIPRAISRDVEIDGIRFVAGRRLFILIINALKRPEYFPDPLRFDIAREIDARFKHLCFGSGAHFCIGFPLAYREIGAVLEELLQVQGTPRILARGYPRGMSFPAYTRLVVKLDR
jgi:cytochrome P450